MFAKSHSLTTDTHLITKGKMPASSGLGLTVDRYLTRHDQVFGFSACTDETSHLQKLPQGDGQLDRYRPR